MIAIERRIAAVVRLAAEIIVVLDAEIDCLRAMKTRDLMSMVNKKAGLIHAFETELRAISSLPEFRAALIPALGEELRGATRRLQAALMLNARMIEAARTANERLLAGVVEAVQGQRRRLAGYGPPPGRSSAPHARLAPASPIALDRRF